MLDLIQFVFDLFTEPVKAIATIVFVVLMIAGIRWFASRSNSNLPLDAAPEVILRHRLKFDDEDLEQNRSAAISPKQIKRMRKEFLNLLVAYMALAVFSVFLFVTLFWEDMSRWGPAFLVGLLGCMGVVLLFIIGMAAFQLWGYLKDLRTRNVIALLSPMVFEENEGELMGLKFRTHQYKLVVNDPRLPESLPFHIGFMSEDVWSRVQELNHRSAILYIAPNTSKLLSFELVVPAGPPVHSHS